MADRKSKILSKLLFVLLIAFLAITVLLTLLGGAGTICVAFNAEDYEAMKALVPFKTIYKLFVAGNLALGIWGIQIVKHFFRRRPGVYRNALIVLTAGLLLSGSQTMLSKVLRGSFAPGNIRFCITAITLALFLIFLIPGLRKLVDFEKATSNKSFGRKTVSIALFFCSFVMFFIKLWTGTSHISPTGQNWIDIAILPIQIVATIMFCSAIFLMFKSSFYNLFTFIKSKLILQTVQKKSI